MYFPYLRGRQFELIALRELVEKSLISEKIIPIIEPVKLSSTLIKTIEIFNEKNRKIALIMNPQIGSLKVDLNEEKKESLKEKLKTIIQLPVLIKTHILNKNSKQQLIRLFNNGTKPEDLITICQNKDFISIYEEIFKNNKPQYNLILDESVYRRKIKDNRILLDDKFNKLTRNTDYADSVDEPFSDDHIYFQQDGYKGFADYTVIGNEFAESGFAPYAVAIHIVYFDKEKSLRIRHFVSDSNDDIRDPANKFSEAVRKLFEWNESAKLDTVGIKTFIDLYKNELYPGLGTVKKLSIMHHIEIVGKYLDAEPI